MLNLFKTAHLRAWIAGLARPPVAPTGQGEPGVLAYYHPILDSEVGEEVGCWRLTGESDDEYAFRLGVHLCEQANAIEALLQKVLNYKKRT